MDFDKTINLEAVDRYFSSGEDSHFLVVVNGSSAGRHLVVDEIPRIVGRSETAGIRIQDQGISGVHCLVRIEGGEFVVTDLGATNGTFVNGERIVGEEVLPVGAILQMARTLLRHEVRTEGEARREQEMSEELSRAVSYVRALLPEPICEGGLSAEWRFIPSAQLGGDAFGYHRLDERRTALYLLDVCGHGVGAALHSVSAINAIRRQTLGATDFGEPCQVLEALNRAFPMEEHGQMFFTLWYGVYDSAAHRLVFASAGHPAARLVPPAGGDARGLLTKGMPIGTLPGAEYRQSEVEVEPGSRLYVFSDGAYEIVTREGRDWRAEEFAEILAEPPVPGLAEPTRIEQRVRSIMEEESFPDDFSLLCIQFVS